jgi:TetR/AcrR family transcriptional repressor of mexJK operon
MPKASTTDVRQQADNLAGREVTAELGRSARKHRAIMTAATAHFLRDGYQGTSMDEVAASAGVSKQTVYKHFTDKQRLFEAIVVDTLDRAGNPFRAEIEALADVPDLRAGLLHLAQSYLAAVLRPDVLQFRRMVIGEAARQPDLARLYYDRAPDRTLRALADCFADLAARGRLHVADSLAAAQHFAFLVIGPSLDRSLFCGDQPIPEEAHAASAVRVFLAAYAPDR